MIRRLLISGLLCAPLLGAGCGGAAHAGARVHSLGEPVHYMPGGLQTIATGPVRGAAGFSIRAERYRFEGKSYFNLADDVRELGGGGGGGSFAPQGAKPLSWTMVGGCSARPPSRWTILYGLLRATDDRAFAYTAHRRYQLSVARIPSNFHARGLAAYAVLPEPPIRVLVQTPAGRTALREELEPPSKEPCHPGGTITYFVKHT